VLLACFLGMGVSTVSLMGYSAGVFIQPLGEAFGWTRAEIGTSGIISNVVLMTAAPFAGRLIDRHGLRRVATTSMLLYAAGVFALSRIQGDILVFFALCAVTSLVGVASTPLAFTRAITAFFVRRRGLALGLGLTSTGVAGVLAPTLLTPFVAEYGWRAGYAALAAIIFLSTPIVWALVRDHPGAAAQKTGSTAAVEGVTLAQARRDPTFWTMGLVFMLTGLAVNGLVVSFIPMLLDWGSPPGSAGSLAALIGAAVMGGRLITGLLIDRLFAPHVAATVFTMAAAGLVAFWFVGPPAAAVAAICLGLAMGAEVDLIGYLTARYFGLANYGAIFGSQYCFLILGAGVSPIAAGAIYDITGEYSLALLASAMLLILAALAALALRRFPGSQPDAVANDFDEQQTSP
jgi:MFS family permease